MVSEREGIDEDGHRESYTSEAGDGKELAPAGVFRHGSKLAFDGKETCQGDAQRLSYYQTEEYAHAYASYFRKVPEYVEIG